jgi:hypothetical protein
MATVPKGPPCAVCSDPVDPDTAHWAHEADCPLPAVAKDDHPEAPDTCGCDLLVHPECCQQPSCFGSGLIRWASVSTCKVCDQMIHLVDAEWHHKMTGVYADLPVHHRATNQPQNQGADR